MDLVDLDVDDLFADGDLDPQIESDVDKMLGGSDEEGEDVGMLERLHKMSKEKDVAAKKHTARLKLDCERLLSDRGLPALVPRMSQVKLKGRGHELSDLDAVLKAYEHWAHRLFPQFAFDDFIERMETLGRKAPIRTALRKLRSGLHVKEDEDQDEDKENLVRHNDERELEEQVEVSAGATGVSYGNNDSILNKDSTTDFSFDHRDDPNQSTVPKQNDITPSQKERMEMNRRLALEKRQQRQNTSLSQI